MNDQDFISGKFLDYEIPKDKRYLLKYFTTELQRAFLRYYLLYGEWKNFCDHTGHACLPHFVPRMVENFHKVVSNYERAKKSFTEEGMATVLKIEMGTLPLTKMSEF